MPREDVPYPMSSQICSIRERIAELQDEINGLLATINSVGGDGQKDIKLLSDNAALSITNDPVQHEIHLDLDASQLPAADVNSVNGQTGTVVLDGDDLDGVTPGNSVNDDISTLQTADGTLQGNINAEALARQNADSTLQNNINAALATIPGEVSSQIAADATINGLVAADAQNVKLTGAQSISGVKTFTANPKGANPASGATDTSLVNANWISQSGNTSPNNVVHKIGNEAINGVKNFLAITQRTSQYNYVDYHYNDTSVIQHKGIRFYCNNRFSGEILFRTNPVSETMDIELNITNTYASPPVSGSFILTVNKDGTKSITTNFPKPTNW